MIVYIKGLNNYKVLQFKVKSATLVTINKLHENKTTSISYEKFKDNKLDLNYNKVNSRESL